MEESHLKQVTADGFRQLMGNFATGVTVVTAVDTGGRRAGMTASAVAAVSLEPPLVLVCVNSRDQLHSVMQNVSTFAVNVLASDQESTSRLFADKTEDRFENADWYAGPNGVPLLRGVLANMVCEPWSAHQAGDHTIFVGRVVQGTSDNGDPLLHVRGKYATTTGLKSGRR